MKTAKRKALALTNNHKLEAYKYFLILMLGSVCLTNIKESKYVIDK